MADIEKTDGSANPAARVSGELASLIQLTRDKPVLMARMAVTLSAKGEKEIARQLCTHAISLAPGEAEVRVLVAEVLSQEVPNYYASLVRDTARHQLYEGALRRAIRPGCRVLDIGSGTGLFALMAARAGAAEVITCESNPVVAKAVAAVVAQNGFGERIRVLAKPSFDLKIGSDFVDRPDLILWDNLSRTLVGAGALATVEHAVRHFAGPDTQVIPARGSIRVALAEHLHSYAEMDAIEGFDLSAFRMLAYPCYRIHDEKESLRLCGDPIDLFRFDFESGGPFPEARSEAELASRGGRANGVAQWISLELDDHATYESVPPAQSTSSLGALFYPFEHSLECAAGQNIHVTGSHDRNTLRIWQRS
ncbi:50S ribosomal protein L11 methyltransferase [Rhodoplanes sp. Z2-YC6860]|uniref:50S ribosomal protein L11 methyltransferase n=1 Tax=Rhodoplanes sp. Z2-YC6860 TaxID=674703 RepID=UPI00078E6C4D|nr:50S ribosomal protein L11 methyltransferase [Rhodoplanes sp. Z2-YC6860]AMN43754.1 protein arginine N-methyltransferase [Rhodoplanes sp. Z2-YC6860]